MFSKYGIILTWLRFVVSYMGILMGNGYVSNKPDVVVQTMIANSNIVNEEKNVETGTESVSLEAVSFKADG